MGSNATSNPVSLSSESSSNSLKSDKDADVTRVSSSTADVRASTTSTSASSSSTAPSASSTAVASTPPNAALPSSFSVCQGWSSSAKPVRAQGYPFSCLFNVFADAHPDFQIKPWQYVRIKGVVDPILCTCIGLCDNDSCFILGYHENSFAKYNLSECLPSSEVPSDLLLATARQELTQYLRSSSDLTKAARVKSCDDPTPSAPRRSDRKRVATPLYTEPPPSNKSRRGKSVRGKKRSASKVSRSRPSQAKRKIHSDVKPCASPQPPPAPSQSTDVAPAASSSSVSQQQLLDSQASGAVPSQMQMVLHQRVDHPQAPFWLPSHGDAPQWSQAHFSTPAGNVSDAYLRYLEATVFDQQVQLQQERDSLRSTHVRLISAGLEHFDSSVPSNPYSALRPSYAVPSRTDFVYPSHPTHLSSSSRSFHPSG